MKLGWTVAAIALGLTLASPAAACRVPPPAFNPNAQLSDAILFGRVINDVGVSGAVQADIEVDHVIGGSYDAPAYSLRWYVPDGKGMCPPPGPNVRKGDEVILYLSRSSDSFTALGWMLVDQAASVDQRVRKALSVKVKAAPSRVLAVVRPLTYGSAVSLDDGKFVATDDHANVYIDWPLRTGKHYWEVRLLCGPLMPGVTNDVEWALRWGGYSQENAGVYTWSVVAWPEPSSGSRSEAWDRRLAPHSGRADDPFGLPASGAIFGFALDVDARTLRTFWDGDEGPTVKLGFDGPYYPHAGVQIGFTLPEGQPCTGGAASGEFLFRRGATRYSPPSGYRLLGG